MTNKLDFICDKHLYKHVSDTIEKYRFSIDFDKLNQNLLDPIRLSFDGIIYQGGMDNQSMRAVLDNEIMRQMDKSNTNHIGYFHQNIFRYLGGDEWIVPPSGFDVENTKQHIFVEMKNKHNTMNSASCAKTYLKMQNTLLHHKNPNAQCFLVEVIAKKSQNIAWCCSVDGQKMSHERIRRICIDVFYEMVTGQKNAFAKLCQQLPQVIMDVLRTKNERVIQNSVIDDIQKARIEHILTALYLKTFASYQGFDASFALADIAHKENHHD